MPHLTRADRATLTGLLLLISSVYFATFVGVTSSNDGSHYALLRALADKRSFEISDYLSFTEFQDYALNGERRFSDRPPGTAFWALPFYVAGRLFPEPVAAPPSKHDAGQPLLMGVGAATAMAGALAVGLFYLILRQHFELTNTSAALAAMGLAFGTVMWKYGSVLYSHSVAAMVVLLALYLAGHLLRQPAGAWIGWALLGLALGASTLVEYTNALLVILVGAFMAAWAGRTLGGQQRSRALGALALGVALPILLLLAYNTLNFGGPFEFSTFHVDTNIWPQNESLGTDFAAPLLVGLQGLLLWGSNNQGLFLLSPLSWLGLPGLVLLWRRSRRDFVLFAGLFFAMLLIFSKSTTFNAGTNDGRYLTPFLGLWFIPAAFSIDRILARRANDLKAVVGAFLLFGLFFLSVRNIFWHIAFSWNYGLDLARLLPFSVHLDNIRYLLGTVFPNAVNVWWLWWLQGLCALVVWAASQAWGSLRSRLAAFD